MTTFMFINQIRTDALSLSADALNTHCVQYLASEDGQACNDIVDLHIRKAKIDTMSLILRKMIENYRRQKDIDEYYQKTVNDILDDLIYDLA